MVVAVCFKFKKHHVSITYQLKMWFSRAADEDAAAKSVGVLLAVVGYAVGSFAAMLCAELMSMVAP